MSLRESVAFSGSCRLPVLDITAEVLDKEAMRILRRLPDEVVEKGLKSGARAAQKTALREARRQLKRYSTFNDLKDGSFTVRRTVQRVGGSPVYGFRLLADRQERTLRRFKHRFNRRGLSHTVLKRRAKSLTRSAFLITGASGNQLPVMRTGPKVWNSAQGRRTQKLRVLYGPSLHGMLHKNEPALNAISDRALGTIRSHVNRAARGWANRHGLLTKGF